MITCRACDGAGRIGRGRMVGPCEYASESACETCHGSGDERCACATCETVEATLIDSSGSPSCAACAADFAEWRARQQREARAA